MNRPCTHCLALEPRAEVKAMGGLGPAQRRSALAIHVPPFCSNHEASAVSKT